MFDRQQRTQQRQDFFKVQWPQVYNGFGPVGRKRFGTKSNDHYFDIFNESEYPYPKDDNLIPVKIGINQSQIKNNQSIQNYNTLDNPLLQENTIQENQIPCEQLQYDFDAEKQVSQSRRQRNDSRNEKYIRLNKSMDQALTERAPLSNSQEKSFYYGKRKQQEIQMQNRPNINQLKKIEKPLTKEELVFARKINKSTSYGSYDFIQNKVRLEKLKDLEKQQMMMQKQKELEMKQKNEYLYKQIKYKEALQQQQRIKIQMETNPQDLKWLNGNEETLEEAQNKFYMPIQQPNKGLGNEIMFKSKPKSTSFNPIMYQEIDYTNFKQKKQPQEQTNQILYNQSKNLVNSQNQNNNWEQYLQQKENYIKQRQQNENSYLNNQKNTKLAPVKSGTFKVNEMVPQKSNYSPKYYRGKYYPDTNKLLQQDIYLQ